MPAAAKPARAVGESVRGVVWLAWAGGHAILGRLVRSDAM